jgi:hypothetical protein
MFDVILAQISTAIAAIPFSAPTWFLIGVMSFFVWLFSKAQRNPNSLVDWEDLILDHATNRTSPYKLGYVIGLVVGTWVIVKFADDSKLTWDIFGGYLAYLLGGAGWITMNQTKSAVAPAPAPAKVPASTPAPKVDDVI